MPCRNIPLRYRKQAGQPCFRGEQIVAAGVEAIVSKGIAYRQQFPLGIKKKREIHRKCHLARPVGEVIQPALQEMRRSGDLQPITAMFDDHFSQRLDPKNQLPIPSLNAKPQTTINQSPVASLFLLI